MSAVHKDKGTEPCASSSVQIGIMELLQCDQLYKVHQQMQNLTYIIPFCYKNQFLVFRASVHNEVRHSHFTFKVRDEGGKVKLSNLRTRETSSGILLSRTYIKWRISERGQVRRLDSRSRLLLGDQGVTVGHLFVSHHSLRRRCCPSPRRAGLTHTVRGISIQTVSSLR